MQVRTIEGLPNIILIFSIFLIIIFVVQHFSVILYIFCPVTMRVTAHLRDFLSPSSCSDAPVPVAEESSFMRWLMVSMRCISWGQADIF